MTGKGRGDSFLTRASVDSSILGGCYFLAIFRSILFISVILYIKPDSATGRHERVGTSSESDIIYSVTTAVHSNELG